MKFHEISRREISDFDFTTPIPLSTSAPPPLPDPQLRRHVQARSEEVKAAQPTVRLLCLAYATATNFSAALAAYFPRSKSYFLTRVGIFPRIFPET